MPKLVVGPINSGLRSDRLPFNIDNDSFPTLINAYQWRGRLKRKRGTAFLGRLQRFLGVTNGAGNLTVTIAPTPITSGIAQFSVGSNIFTDPGGASPVTLLTTGPGTATLNRTTGVLTIIGSNATTNVIYFPGLPVMGLEDLILGTAVSTQNFAGTIGFDTTYAYNITNAIPATITDVSFYKNPQTGPLGYVPKSTWTPTTWNGQNYQQFWSINYQGAFWVTNGVQVPFNPNNIGMQFGVSSATVRLSATTMSFTIVGNPLVVGDWVFINEVTASAGGSAQAINFQTGFVTVAGNTFTVTFPDANIPAGTYAGGMVQFLTNRSNTAVDVLRWYDGDPTGGTIPPVFGTSVGWVNFAPPLSENPFSIADLPIAQYYLVGAKIITQYKDRLLFLGPVVQTSSGTPIYLQDTVIYSQNGTPYYTASFTGDPASIGTTFNQLLVPDNQTATPGAYWCDQPGFGGFITAGIDQPINTVGENQDTLIVGFKQRQTRLVYTGNDLLPFNFYSVNSELGSSSTFSAIVMDAGIFSLGGRGILLANQTGAARIDLSIPDQVFEIDLTNNAKERVTAVRDYINEWIYVSYPANDENDDTFPFVFNTQTLQYNYRDQTWAIHNESYTTYGQFRTTSGLTWAGVGAIYGTWRAWNDPWNSGVSTTGQPVIIAGNQQGYIVVRDDNGTNEANTLSIQNISGSTVTVPNHCMNIGDYFIINGATGTVASQVNGLIFSVGANNYGVNGFDLNPNITGGTYTGGGTIQRMYVPIIQSRQFPVAWEMGRKTRIGPQQYLITTTETGQITLLIFLSQNTVGSPLTDATLNNPAMVYSTVLYTCPESTNIGLTPLNSNLQQNVAAGPTAGSPVATNQDQIWHRVNNSIIGDTVQIGFWMNDSQMRDVNLENQFAEIEIHGFIMDLNQSSLLS